MFQPRQRSPASRAGGPIGRWVAFGCLLAYLAFGLAVFRNFGYAADEDPQREIGVVAVKDAVERVAPSRAPAVLSRLVRLGGYPEVPASLDAYYDRDYGVAFEAPAVLLEVLAGLADTRDIFLFRHLLTFLFCLGGVCAVYCLAARRFANAWMGLLAAACLVLSPRLFADSFYNSKDAVFMAAVAIALNTAVAFVLRPNPGRAVLHALATAIAMDIRIAGIVLPAATVAILTVRLLKREIPAGRTLAAVAGYLAATALFVVAFWPWLWSDPLGHFGQALASMSKFRFDGEILYLGGLIRATGLPWHYVPVWISITTPPLYLLLFVAGVIAIGRRLASAGVGLWKSEAELQDLIFLGMCVAPIAAVILLHSTLYNAWRQLYFIYPAFLLVALGGFHALWNAAGRVGRPVIATAMAISMAVTAVWMWRAHPLQAVYFNSLAGTDLKSRFEMDYWSLSEVGALEHVLAHDAGAKINVLQESADLVKSVWLLRPQDRRRLRVVTDPGIPHYLVTNEYRFLRRGGEQAYLDRYDLYHEVKVDGEAVMLILKSRVPPGSVR